MSVLLVDLQTGETIEADEYRLLEIGLPEGYRIADTVATKEWINALRGVLHGRNSAKLEP